MDQSMNKNTQPNDLEASQYTKIFASVENPVFFNEWWNIHTLNAAAEKLVKIFQAHSLDLIKLIHEKISNPESPIKSKDTITPFPIDYTITHVSDHITFIVFPVQKDNHAKLSLIGLHTLFDHMPNSVVIADKNWIIQGINPAFTETFWYTTDETIGKKVDSIVCDSENRDEGVTITTDANNGIIHKDHIIRATKQWIKKHFSLVVIPHIVDGTQVWTYGIYTDITKQILLQQRDAIARTIIDSFQWGTFISKVWSTEIIPMNRAAATILWYSDAWVLMSKTVLDIIPKADLQQFLKNVDIVNSIGHHVFTSKMIQANGDTIHVRLDTTIMPDGETHVVFFQDITEEIEKMEQFHALLERSESILNQMSEPVMIVDNEDQIMQVNPAFTKLTWYTKEKAIWQIWYKLVIHPDDHHVILGQNRAREKNEHGHYEVRFVHKDGAIIPCEIKWSPLHTKDGQTIGSIWVISDLSIRMAA